MLIGIPKIISPELLKILAEMGHGDTIVLADGNFPAESVGRRVVRMDGHGVVETLDAVLSLYPLDTYVDFPVTAMDVVPGDTYVPTIWGEFEALIKKHYPDGMGMEKVDRFGFYERAKDAYAVVATGESKLYANVIIKKGVIK